MENQFEMPDFSLSLPATDCDVFDEFELDGDHVLLSKCADEMEELMMINSAAGDASCASNLNKTDQMKVDKELKWAAYYDLPPPQSTVTDTNLKKRFYETSENEMKTLFAERQSKNTKRNTAWGIKLFQDWNVETRGQPMDMSNVSTEELANALRKFYTEARPKSHGNSESGDFYHKNTLINIRGVINRHLSDQHRNIDIIRDKEFRYANGVLDGLLKLRAKSGKSKPTNHKPIIEKCDLEKISTYLSKAFQNPIILRHNVWYNLSIHFVTRGMEFHHQLSTNSFTFHNSDEYVSLNHSTQQKNYQGGINSDEAPTDKRMYSTGTASCPVKMLQLLISKSDTTDGPCALFTQYKRNAMESPQTHNTWYTRKPLSKRTFSNFLPDVCKSSGVVNNYTPHCLRATAVQFLNDQGHETRHIMYMSSHKNESSLRSYTRNVSTEQKKALSSSLAAITLPSDENLHRPTDFPAGALSTRLHADSVLSQKETMALSVPEKNNINPILPTQITFQSNNSMSSHPGYFTNATFSGCTINFNN